MFTCGTIERVKWYKEELLKHVPLCQTNEELGLVVAWYLQEGMANGLQKAWLIKELSDHQSLYDVAIALSEGAIQLGRKPPLFREGDSVEVIVNAKNVTYHKGTIHSVIYHVKDREWNYYICEDNKKVSKRYSSADLKSAVSQKVEPIKKSY